MHTTKYCMCLHVLVCLLTTLIYQLIMCMCMRVSACIIVCHVCTPSSQLLSGLIIDRQGTRVSYCLLLSRPVCYGFELYAIKLALEGKTDGEREKRETLVFPPANTMTDLHELLCMYPLALWCSLCWI